jgi:NAD-dependent SIR2 family protein deacetylase
MDTAIEALADLIGDRGVVVLTGAGISTDSGIPDYRGDGRRLRRTPMTYQEFVGDGEARRRYWARSHVGWTRMKRARPNRSHYAVARLQAEGYVRSVITQNVDGLHQEAGSEDVLELHGSLAETVCLGCGDRRSRLELQHRLEAANPHFSSWATATAPDGDADLPDELVEGFRIVDCLDCGGVLKPDVVFFGESVPRPRVVEAFRRVDESSCLLVLGSSLTVMSGYRFVLAARKAGTPVAIVNRGPTRGDGDATVRVDAGLAESLERLCNQLGRSRLVISG